MLSGTAGRVRRKPRLGNAQRDVARQATHGETSSFSIADRFGNLVSVTHSVNGTFGSGIVVDGGGFVLNNRLPCFYLDDGNVNILAPGKRTRHTINPALALKDGKPFLAWNTPGGDNQPQAMLQAFLARGGVRNERAAGGRGAHQLLSTSFHDSVYPHPVAGTLVMPKVLAEQVRRGAFGEGPSGGGDAAAEAVRTAAVGSRRGEDGADRSAHRDICRRSQPGERRLRDGVVISPERN